jgi:hypothetical protein
MISIVPCVSPRKSQARAATWTSIVLLSTDDSTADSVRSVLFQRVKATAVFTTASQAVSPQEGADKRGRPSTEMPAARRRAAPIPMLMAVTTIGLATLARFTCLPNRAAAALAATVIPARVKPKALPPTPRAGAK